MKLSEAIRLGAMASGKCVDWFARGDDTCAQGAALLAIGRLLKTGNTSLGRENHAAMQAAWPWADVKQTVRCPSCGKERGFVRSLIAHLNNECGWTRERIADWVATIEPPEQSADITPEPEVVHV